MTTLSYEKYLPKDGFAGTLVGRAWLPASVTGSIAGPSPVWIREDGVYDLSSVAATSADLISNQPLQTLKNLDLNNVVRIGSYEDVVANTLAAEPDADKARFLCPVDVQAVKACGVTFVCSMLERMIEERAGGDPARAAAVRDQLKESVDVDLNELVPGSPEALALKEILIKEGLWSQYLEVGIGPYAEVFSKAQPMSSVGLGDQIGINDISTWNNPEPEVVLIVDSEGEIQGAALGNDVNLRDVEGRSALLLGKAKDNNASSSIGPFVRLLDDTFSLDDVRNQNVVLNIVGKEDGYEVEDNSNMQQISRDITDLVTAARNKSHQYPDGFALYTGTVCAPIFDRDEDGMGFTHKLGDVVRISSEKLGCLENEVTYSHLAPKWEFGTLALMKNLAARKLLG